MTERKGGRVGPKDVVWTIEGLGADGPDCRLKDKLMLFGQFVGDWDIVKAWYRLPGGSAKWQKGEVHFGWILGGRAVQDVWLVRKDDPPTLIPIGTTIRFYDQKTDTWASTWISPSQGQIQRFVGRHVDGGIVLETRNAEGFPEKWIFSDIKQDSFRWHSEETHDGGKTWIQTEEMFINRRS